MHIKPMKDQNRLRLTLVVTVNVTTFYTMIAAPSLAAANWLEAWRSVGMLLPAALGAVLISILNAQLDATMKARIVFLRWNCPLPGAQAFTRFGPADIRIDMESLKDRLGEFPVEPYKQNALWYRLYREVADSPAIVQANREYLFTRDYHVLAIGIFFVLGIFSYWAIDTTLSWTGYIIVLLLQVILTGRAARNHGRSLVCNVLALSTPLVPKHVVAPKKKRR